MRSCLKPSPPSTNNYLSSPASQDNTPTSSVQLSPTVNLSQEYTLAIKTISYSEIQRTFDENRSFNPSTVGHVDTFEAPQLLDKVLRPSRENVQEALSLISPNSLTYLATTYFENSEHSSRLYLLLYQTIHHVRLLYDPIYNLLDDLPIEFDSDHYTLSPAECEMTFNVFVQFDRIETPFFSPDSHNFDDIRKSFSELRQQLDHHLVKSRSKVQLIRRCSMGFAWCLIAAGVGVAVSAVVIATHALVALLAGPMCSPAVLPSSITKKEMVHLAQLDAAAKGAYVVQKDLDTIDRLVARLHAAVENDRLLIHLGLERGMDRYSIEEILKQLQRNRAGFVRQLVDLEEHLFLCFAAINRARALLLEEIHMHHSTV